MSMRWVAAAVLMAGCAAPQVLVPTGPGIPPVAIGEGRSAPEMLQGTLLLPDGPGLKPVVIVLHGCGGLSGNSRDWAGRLAGWGYGSLMLDSFHPRHVTNVCPRERQPLVTRFDRAADVVAAVRWLRTQPGVDATRIAVLGDSHGGATAATVALHPYADEVAGSVRGVIDYYGACRQPTRYAGMPLLALAGTDDDWSDPARSCAEFKAHEPADADIEAVAYAGTVHGFENHRLVQRRYNEGHPMQYAREPAEDSFRRVKAFLDRLIGPAKT